MSSAVDRIRLDFDRIAQHEAPRGPLDPHERWILAHASGRRRVLDVGCGSGALCRELASTADEVVGIDLSPGMLARARSLTPHANVRYVEADFPTWTPPQSFDCVVSVAAFHHLPQAAALRHAGAVLRPGGVLLVVDLFAAVTPTELPFTLLSWLLRWPRRRCARTSACRDAWRDHAAHDDLRSLRRLRRIWLDTLPGSTVQRCLGWRYRASWRREAASAPASTSRRCFAADP